jgi:hypothetical protein
MAALPHRRQSTCNTSYFNHFYTCNSTNMKGATAVATKC